MKRVTLIATRSLRYRNRALKAGEYFTVRPSESSLYVTIGIAKNAPAAPQPTVKPAPQPSPPQPQLQQVDTYAAELEQHRVRYESLTGIAADKRWGLARLKSEIAAALAGGNGGNSGERLDPSEFG